MTITVTMILFFFLSIPMRGACISGNGCTSLNASNLFSTVHSRSLTAALMAIPSEPRRPGGAGVGGGRGALGPMAMGMRGMKGTRRTIPGGAITTGLGDARRPITGPIAMDGPTLRGGRATAPSDDGGGGCCVVMSDLPATGSTRRMLGRCGRGKCGRMAVVRNGKHCHLSLYGFTSGTTTCGGLGRLGRGSTFGGT